LLKVLGQFTKPFGHWILLLTKIKYINIKQQGYSVFNAGSNDI
jgi:hypothetical protein